MATSAQTMDNLMELLPAGVTHRKMFGEYAVYLEGRVVALVCDDTLFIKPTPGARALMVGAEMGPPYPGAKDHLVAGEVLDDPALLAQVLRKVAEEVPLPKSKKAKAR